MGLEKAAEQEIKLPTFNESWKKQRISRKTNKQTNLFFIDYIKAFDCVDYNKLWKILEEMGVADHINCLLRNLYQVKKQQLELDMEQQTGSSLKYIRQGCLWPPCLFNLYAEYIMQNVGLDASLAGIEITGEITKTSDMQMIPL